MDWGALQRNVAKAQAEHDKLVQQHGVLASTLRDVADALGLPSNCTWGQVVQEVPKLQADLKEVTAGRAALAGTLVAVATALELPQDCTRVDLIQEAHKLRATFKAISHEVGKVMPPTPQKATGPTVAEVNQALLAGSLLLAPSGLPVLGPPAPPRPAPPAAHAAPFQGRFRIGYRVRISPQCWDWEYRGKVGVISDIDWQGCSGRPYQVEISLADLDIDTEGFRHSFSREYLILVSRR